MPTTRNQARKDRRLKVGTRVRFIFGAGEVEAEVVEDRGSLGAGGRQIVRVRLLGDWGASDDGGEDTSFEMPAEELSPVAPAPARRGNRKPRPPAQQPTR